MSWLVTSLNWYIYLFILGVIFFPLTKKIFRRFSYDAGYPFAKTLAILLISYTMFVLGTVKILPFTQFTIFAVAFAYALINIFFIFQGKKIQNSKFKIQNSIIIFEELLFLASFLFWTYIRSQEPSIHSLEKFMDFGFINSILRAEFFPPKDIWYSGSPINYYYFGHLTVAALIKLIGTKPSIGYNLILSSIFALAISQVFSLVANIINLYLPKAARAAKIAFFALLGAFIVNLGGNLHTIYAFTTGYPNENLIPFWRILSGFNPTTYWYPNATRFIPFTIHEFPSYSYVVADLHGHVFDIPFVLLTLAILFLVFTGGLVSFRTKRSEVRNLAKRKLRFTRFLASLGMTWWVVLLGFLTALHYMTNAFDGPIYLLLTIVIFLIVFQLSFRFIINLIFLIFSFLIFSLPFSYHFKPFVAGIGVNCGSEIFSYIGEAGPFLFEKDKCQASPFWMLFILWGFFWVSFALFSLIRNKEKQYNNVAIQQCNNFIFLLFSFGTFLVIIPEFFYIKDIYPAHFRANTMFKLGYQAFIMMGIAATITFFRIKLAKRSLASLGMTWVWIFFFFFIFIYPFFSIPSYYGPLNRPVELDGEAWLKTSYPEDKEIVDYLNSHVKNQPIILEAQGDSYTDFERISAMTGLPTVAGWWVHEWLWRGSSNVIAQRIPDVIALYESPDIQKTKGLIKRYDIKYIIVSKMEKQKYTSLFESKFLKIGKRIFTSSSGSGAIYQVD